MATTTSSKRKKAVAATIAAAAILLAGTFAWTSISQQALNESAGIVNVGGRLHDDFDGKNKDVYVENFTDPLNGGQPIYARIRLDEYMEVGQDAGGGDDGDGIDEVVTILDGTERDKESTWQTHVPEENCAECAAEGSGCVIHDCWEWTMGGDQGGSPDGQTTYMPTFNKDKDSLASDRNGTYQGTNPTDKVYYDDYVTYVTEGGADITLSGNYTQPEGATTANELTEANQDITKVTGKAYYDNDTDGAENETEGQYRTQTETHTAKKTASADVILMKDWNGQAGNFWVYDTDGWAYWANPIMPGEATGLLLDGIKMVQNPGEKCYYGINVVAQFATIGDWEFFEDKDGTLGLEEGSKALEVMTAASNNVPKVTVTNLDGQTTVDAESDDLTVKFSAEVSVGPTASAAAGDFTWEVYDADLNPVTSETSIKENEDGTATLTVSKDETLNNLIVVAKSNTYDGAVGLSSVAVKVAFSTFALTDDLNVDPYAVLAEDGKTAEDGQPTYTLFLVRTKDPTLVSNPTSHRIDGQNVVLVYERDHWYDDYISYGPNGMFIPEWWTTGINSSYPYPQRVVLYIKEVNIVNKMQPLCTTGWFCAMRSIEEIHGLENLDTSKVTSMFMMFANTSPNAPKVLDLSHFDTANVESMRAMFQGYARLEEIKGIESWDMSKVNNMNYMFGGCTNLKLDCSNWKIPRNPSLDSFNENATGVIPPVSGQ